MLTFLHQPHATCGKISYFSTWQMWRFLAFLHMWHVCDVKMSTHMQNLSYCVIKSVVLQITQFCRETVVSWFTHFCVEKNLSKNCISGEKMTNMRSASSPSSPVGSSITTYPLSTSLMLCSWNNPSDSRCRFSSFPHSQVPFNSAKSHLIPAKSHLIPAGKSGLLPRTNLAELSYFFDPGKGRGKSA